MGKGERKGKKEKQGEVSDYVLHRDAGTYFKLMYRPLAFSIPHKRQAAFLWEIE